MNAFLATGIFSFNEYWPTKNYSIRWKLIGSKFGTDATRLKCHSKTTTNIMFLECELDIQCKINNATTIYLKYIIYIICLTSMIRIHWVNHSSRKRATCTVWILCAILDNSFCKIQAYFLRRSNFFNPWTSYLEIVVRQGSRF